MERTRHPARAWRFAGGWAAFSDAVDGAYVAAAGSDAGPDGLELGVLRDGRAYNFDLDGFLHPQVLTASSAARSGGERPPAQRQEWHADQLRLMQEGKPMPAGPDGAADSLRPTLRGSRVRLRSGAPDDVPLLQAIRAEESVTRWWGKPGSADDIAAKLTGDGSSVLLVVGVDGQVAGGIQYDER